MEEIEKSGVNHEPQETYKEGERKKWNEFKKDGFTLNSIISLKLYSKTESVRQFEDS